MSKEIEITVSVHLGYVGCSKAETFTMPKDEWEGMTEDEREECCKEAMLDMFEWNYEVK